MLARVPASSANLGPGFDTLAVALNLYVDVSVEVADGFCVTSAGEGAGLFDDENHLAAVIAREVLGHSRVAIHVESQIPLSRGLGSSASLALAAAAAAGAADPLALATRVDGHAENAAASRYGGLVAAALRDGVPVARSLTLDNEWRFVVVIPQAQLATSDARGVLPREVPFADAVFNLNAMGLLIAGLADRNNFVPGSMNDALHQPYRMALLPFAAGVLATLVEAGASGACWSGAGSTMLGLVGVEEAEAVAAAARTHLSDEGVAGTVRVLDADRTGLVTR
ncbi:MAG: homoserine kinase [Acidimicrobiales bacterium]